MKPRLEHDPNLHPSPKPSTTPEAKNSLVWDGKSNIQLPCEVGGYQLLRKIGSGGMGSVYAAIDGDGRDVAYKLLYPWLQFDPRARARLQREVQLLQRVKSAHVAHVYDAEIDEEPFFLVTELVDGPTLDEDIQTQGAYDIAELGPLGRGIAQALKDVHAAGVIHRDLKPSNVMLGESGPVLIDFGIAQLADDSRLTQTGLVTGTPGFLDPMMVAGDAPSVAGDWFSWAAVLLYAATGRPPFGEGSLNVVLTRAEAGRPDVNGLPSPLARVFKQALSPHVDERVPYSTVLRVIDALVKHDELLAEDVANTALTTAIGQQKAAPAQATRSFTTTATDLALSPNEPGEIPNSTTGLTDFLADDESLTSNLDAPENIPLTPPHPGSQPTPSQTLNHTLYGTTEAPYSNTGHSPYNPNLAPHSSRMDTDYTPYSGTALTSYSDAPLTSYTDAALTSYSGTSQTPHFDPNYTSTIDADYTPYTDAAHTPYIDADFAPTDTTQPVFNSSNTLNPPTLPADQNATPSPVTALPKPLPFTMTSIWAVLTLASALAPGISLSIFIVVAIVLSIYGYGFKYRHRLLNQGIHNKQATIRTIIRSPWHLIAGIGVLIPGLLIGSIIGVATAIVLCRLAHIPIVFSLLGGTGLCYLITWFTPYSASLRSGSRHVIRKILPQNLSRLLIVIFLIAGGTYFAIWLLLDPATATHIHWYPLPNITSWLMGK